MRKDAPTIGNPLMMKMDMQSKKMNKNPHGGIETSSKYSRGYKTVSGKSRQEEDYEQMSIEEIDCIIEKAQKEIEQAMDIKRRILRHKMLTNKIKKKKLEPVENTLAELRWKVQQLEIIKDKKIPFYEKLPKDLPFYKHYMSVIQATRIQEVATMKAEEDRHLLLNAALTIQVKA